MSSTSSCPTPSNKSPSRSIHHPYHTLSHHVAQKGALVVLASAVPNAGAVPLRGKGDPRASSLLFTFLYFALTQDIRADNPQRQLFLFSSGKAIAQRDRRQCVGITPPPTVLLYRV